MNGVDPSEWLDIMNANEMIKTALIGKTLTGCEFGMNESGCQTVTVPQRITDARLGTTEGDYDPCVWLTLENGEDAYFYANEDIYLSNAEVRHGEPDDTE